MFNNLNFPKVKCGCFKSWTFVQFSFLMTFDFHSIENDILRIKLTVGSVENISVDVLNQ